MHVIDPKYFRIYFSEVRVDQSLVSSQNLMAKPTSGGVTASTEMLAAKRHAGVHTPVIACKMIIANQQMAYAA